jgi:hypothetical protein
MTRGFSMAQLVYAFFFTIFYHGYFTKETPFVSVDVLLDYNDLVRPRLCRMTACLRCAESALRAWQLSVYPNLTWTNANTSNFDLSKNGLVDPQGYMTPVLSVPELKAYCAVGATDYTWGANGTRAYVNNSCVPYYTPFELSERGHQSVWMYTYFQQQHWSRLCEDSTWTPKYYVPDPPGYPEVPADQKDYDFKDPGFVPNCADPKLEAQRNIMVIAPEKLINVTIAGSYTTTWGRTRSSMYTRITARDPEMSLPLPSGALGDKEVLEFHKVEKVSLSFETLLAMAGIDLDATNVLDDGGLGPLNGTAFPTYRLTGVGIVAEMIYGNFLENTTFAPFNFDDHLEMRVYASTMGTFASPGTKLFYGGHAWALNTRAGENETHPYGDSLFTTRTPQGVQLSFIGAGYIGTFDGRVLLGTIITILFLSDFAQTITDYTAGFLIEGFRAQKYMDDLELRIRGMLRSQLADSPVPEQVRMFEAETIELYANRAYAASQRSRMAELEAKQAAEDAKYGPPPGAGGDAPEEVAPEDEPPPELVSRGAALRSAAVDANKPAPPPGAPRGLAAVLPRVVTLVIAGEPVHGAPLTAQGHLHNCRCVRFQWLRSVGGGPWEAIPYATLPTFFPTFDDVGHLIAVEATPVTDDGFEGGTKRARLGPLTTLPAAAVRSAELVSDARASATGVAISDGVLRGGSRATLTLRKLDIALKGAGGVEYGRLPMEGARAEMDRRDGRVMHIVAQHGGDAAPSLSVTFSGPEQRDEVAMAIRVLAVPPTAPKEPEPETAGGLLDVPTDDEAPDE